MLCVGNTRYMRLSLVGVSEYMVLVFRESCKWGEGSSVFAVMRCCRLVSAVGFWGMLVLVQLFFSVSGNGGFAVFL